MRNFDQPDAVLSRMRLIAVTVFALFAATISAFGGVTYDFTNTATGMMNQSIAGTVKAEGANIRIDIRKGDGMLFQNGSFVVSSDGGQTMNVASPSTRTFYQIDLRSLVGGTDTLLKQFGGAVTFDVRNPKVSVTGGADGGNVGGFATKKSSVDSAYEIAVEGLGQPMSIRMQLRTDVWWTDKISADFTTFLQKRGFRTGIDAVDKLIAAESASIKGFPMKQITTTKVNLGGNEMSTTSTTLVQNVKTMALPPATFAMPAGYAKTANPIETMMARRK